MIINEMKQKFCTVYITCKDELDIIHINKFTEYCTTEIARVKHIKDCIDFIANDCECYITNITVMKSNDDDILTFINNAIDDTDESHIQELIMLKRLLIQ